ncbi:NADPH-dependent 7-cyano-7-deazaguanine reductase QueF [Thalassomonas sp. M1454]|uniref:NADPH-dependent 7-cyano-7-deazaguanine reductase QueF n=1 Tax=Thalassomonas sp. M1454 TaxID=2594477 RepID=UPI001180BD5C|nr:NADPH-dependent 7-cyano-7-deazaguanine reductase QueF [Thalassomonas sp. M1454]TRX57069.1 NADPH-dependent 7-cyano-7-deazaguanine reductase QueF [Thalassomonas sp. M1454]
MTKYQNADELKSLTLGKSTEYASKYSPQLLQGVPRALNRDDLNLKADALPFFGEDVWYGYELSWLEPNGKPVVAVAEFRFCCSSVNLIESKSFKLYLNSFNQSHFSNMDEVSAILSKDLEQVSGKPVQVTLYKVDQCPALAIAPITAQCIDDIDLTIDSYQFDRSILENSTSNDEIVTQYLVSHLLKSNCLITNQPDWGSVYINYTGPKINQEKLLRYLISFRQHNEFHEQCVERIYTDLLEFCHCSSLSVFARYTRRGGLDINPFRSSQAESAPQSRTLRQ